MDNLLIQLAIIKRNREIRILTCLKNLKRTCRSNIIDFYDIFDTNGMLFAKQILGERVKHPGLVAFSYSRKLYQTLNEHREKLDKIDHHLNNINNDLDESEEHINVISGFIGTLKNLFICHEGKEVDAAGISQTLVQKDDSETLGKGNIAVDSNDFQSILNREIQEINDLIKTLLRCAKDFNRELDEQNRLIEDENRECADAQDKLNKETKACDNSLKN